MLAISEIMPIGSSVIVFAICSCHQYLSTNAHRTESAIHSDDSIIEAIFHTTHH